jgi:hypothetical protein
MEHVSSTVSNSTDRVLQPALLTSSEGGKNSATPERSIHNGVSSPLDRDRNIKSPDKIFIHISFVS